MKKIILFNLAITFVIISFAQIDSSHFKSGWANLDYAIPESPAFSLLGNNPDNILKPVSVKSIALNIGNYYLSNGRSIPKNLAVEISPLLLNPNTSLNDYNRNKFFYRIRLSIGTSIIDNGAYQMSEGLRFSIFDRTDLRSDKDFLDKLYKSCIDESKAVNLAIQEFVLNNPGTYINTVMAMEDYNNNVIFQKQIDSLAVKYLVSNESVQQIRDLKRKQLWNAPIWEVGLATMQSSPDSLINNSVFNKAGLWSTYGTHLSQNDQLLIGGKFAMVDSNSVWYSNISIGARYYYGGNELRAFVQGEYKYEKTNTATASIGCVFNITNGIWGQFAMNFIFGNNSKVIYKPSFNLSFGTPEKKKI